MQETMTQPNEHGKSESSEPRSHESVMPKPAYDADFARNVFKLIISIRAAADSMWQINFAEAMQNNRIDQSEIEPVAQMMDIYLPFMSCRVQEQKAALEQPALQETLLCRQYLDVINLARDFMAQNRMTEAFQILEFALEQISRHKFFEYAELNRIQVKSLALVVLTQVCELQGDISRAEFFQLALINLINEADESEVGKTIRRSLEMHRRSRLTRLADLCTKQRKHDDAARWRDEISKIPESKLDMLISQIPQVLAAEAANDTSIANPKIDEA
jgi:hypothetical protein